ncbi:MAG: hypothetical protein FWE67_06700 [Planctomycetaceae bacterium]|nr:hypothetical protein [Planctomycetaceae bacterium]
MVKSLRERNEVTQGKKSSLPKICCRKDTGAAFIVQNGQRIYIGKYADPMPKETLQEYHRILAEYAAGCPPQPSACGFNFFAL